MTKIICFAFGIFVATTSFSQVAMFKDKDGFTNVRRGSSIDFSFNYQLNSFSFENKIIDNIIN